MTAAVCRWFATCDNVTETGLAHAALGLVPCCERCAEHVGQAAELVPLPEGEPVASFVPVNVCPCGGRRVEITLRGGVVCTSCGKDV